MLLQSKKSAFTLIELMVAITIIGIISLASYVPYAHHQKKVLLNQAVREVSQSMSEARNLAIHWLNTGSWNVHVGLYFSSGATQIEYYTSTGALNISSLPGDTYKIKQLPQWINIRSIWWTNTEKLISFSAIAGSWSLQWGAWDDEIEFTVSYKNTSSAVLQRELTYYTKSNISDY